MNDNHYEQPRMTDYPRLWRRRIARNWPFGLWLAVLVFIAAFYSRNQQFGRMAGIVEVVEEQVVPQETARLISINVTAGQRVKAGELLAQMDTSPIDAQIAVEDTTLRDARETFTQFQRGMVAAINQAEAAVKTADAAMKTEQMRLQSDQAQAEELRREQKRREALGKPSWPRT